MSHSHTLQNINLETALKMAQAALAKGREAKMAPLVVAVLDVRGVLKAYLAEEGTSLYRFQIAQGKAMGALGMGFGGQELERRAGQAPMFIHAVQALTEGNMVPVRGGVLIRNAKGELLGAMGISGDTSPNDEICAVSGITSAGLVADCGAPTA